MSTTKETSTGYVNTTEPTEDNDMSLTFVVVLLVVALAISLTNIYCLLVLVRDKKLKEKRFEMLTVCLSISDAATGLLSVVFSVQTIYSRVTGNTIPPFCFIGMSLITSTIIFSLLQTLWICLERFIATFPLIKISLRNNWIVPMTFGIYFVCIMFVAVLYLVYGDFWSGSCFIHEFFGKNRITVLSIFQPIYLIVVSIIVLTYAGVIIRINRAWRRIHPSTSMFSRRVFVSQNQLHNQTLQSVCGHHTCTDINGQSSSTQEQEIPITKNGMHKNLKMAITLGLLILVLLISIMPKVIIGLAVVTDPLNKKLLFLLQMSDLFLFLNPLLDPVIYVLRIQSFRERVKFCKCCYP